MKRCMGITVDLIESSYWLGERFSKAQAWIDLVMAANYKDSEGMFAGKVKHYRRGCVYWSDFHLRTRFKWSEQKLRSFLSELEADGKILAKGSGSYREIEIVNYDSMMGFMEGYTTHTNIAPKEPDPEIAGESPSEGQSMSDSEQESEDYSWFDRL